MVITNVSDLRSIFLSLRARMLALVCSGMIACIGVMPAMAQNVGDPPKLYTESQALDGADLYKAHCALCHGNGLEGRVGPTLRGHGFASEKNGFTMGHIFSYVANQMPGGDPGSLKEGEYAAIWAFILQKNGFPAGDKPVDYKTMIKSDLPLVTQLNEKEDSGHKEFQHLGDF